VSGRTQSSYLNVIDLDLRYLYSGGTAGKSLSSFLVDALLMGPPEVRKMLKALKPDIARGYSLKLCDCLGVEPDVPGECLSGNVFGAEGSQ
jgi:hypothetical protein